MLVTTTPCLSDIYMFVDESGNAYFSDYPIDGRYQLFLKTAPVRVEGVKPLREGWMIRYVEEQARTQGVEPSLVRAIIEVESGYDYEAVSKMGARGAMQLLPRAFPEKGRRELMDPLKNIELGIGHLKKLIKKYNGDYTLVLAAYNAGEGAVKKYGGIPPYPETRRYVKKVLSLYGRFRESK